MEKSLQESQKWQVFLNKLKVYSDAHKEILGKISGLTQDKLLEDLKEASKYEKGYYKNNNGVYIYVKGIEVTNDLFDICRMGFNGEDIGVWIHYCIVDDRSVDYIDTPVSVFETTYFNKRWAKPNELMHPTTKEDFETKVRETVKTLCADYTEAINPMEYHKVVSGWAQLYDEFEKVMTSCLKEKIKDRDKEV